MSYRLDQGHGQCTYHIGVEDDGCHSILDYPAISESAWLLESIARSLNSVVLERKMIQNEIVMGDDGQVRLFKEGEEEVLIVDEPPVLGRCHVEPMIEDEKEEKSCGGKLSTAEGAYTRCILTIQRVETHMLDPSPLGLSTLQSRGSSIRDGVDGAVATTEMKKLSIDNSSFLKDDYQASGVENEPAGSVEETLSSRNIRIAVVGNVDAGKSTLIGTLTTSSLDDGRGSSRCAIMKHRHEIESGRTSTATSHLLGFRHSGEVIAGRDRIRAHKIKSEDEIARESYRIVTLMDLAGHEKYLKTTIHGVSSGFADYALILVNSRHPPTHMTQHHLNLCCSFGIPVVVLFTKTDGCPPHALETSKKELAKVSAILILTF